MGYLTMQDRYDLKVVHVTSGTSNPWDGRSRCGQTAVDRFVPSASSQPTCKACLALVEAEAGAEAEARRSQPKRMVWSLQLDPNEQTKADDSNLGPSIS